MKQWLFKRFLEIYLTARIMERGGERHTAREGGKERTRASERVRGRERVRMNLPSTVFPPQKASMAGAGAGLLEASSQELL